MQSRIIHDGEGLRTFAIILESGDEAVACLQRFAEEQNLTAASFKGIGAFREAELSFFVWDTKEYEAIPVREQAEVASLTGDVALEPSGKHAVHVHCVLGRRDGTAIAGHLNLGHVRPTLEIILTESPAHLRKRHDPETGLMLIDLNRE